MPRYSRSNGARVDRATTSGFGRACSPKPAEGQLVASLSVSRAARSPTPLGSRPIAGCHESATGAIGLAPHLGYSLEGLPSCGRPPSERNQEEGDDGNNDHDRGREDRCGHERTIGPVPEGGHRRPSYGARRSTYRLPPAFVSSRRLPLQRHDRPSDMRSSPRGHQPSEPRWA